jgi:DeoR/GlpR family transcriptional regulator of sugar metabolism
VFVGGIVNPDELGTFGILTEESLKRMRINKLFIGCRGLNSDTGLSNDVQAALEIATVRAFAAASNQVVVLADHTKFGRSFLVQMLPISEIDIVVTDGLTPRAILENLGVRQLIVAPPSETR